MRKQALITQLFTSYIILVLIAITLIITISSGVIETFYFDQKTNDLKVRASLMEGILTQQDSLDYSSLQKFSREISSVISTRITIIGIDGVVLADSEEDPENMDLHNDREEVSQALVSGEGWSQRYSFTLDQEHIYYAKLIILDSTDLILRASFSTEDLDMALRSLKYDLITIGVGIIALIALINWYISRMITRPIQVMESGARRFARGKLKLKVPESNIRELGSLARSLNEMADEIYERIRMVTQQKNEQIAILSSMTEGVIALSPEGEILSANKAAASMFGLKSKKMLKRPLYEVIRHADLNIFVTKVLQSRKSTQTRISVFEPEERVLNVIGNQMPARKGAFAGAVLVFTDLTHIQKLEGVRRDFVANVSHELKTPITSIQGYVETLQEGAIDEPDNAERFLGIISKHADRLGQIIDDLLELSRIEEISDEDEKYFKPTSVEGLFDSALQNYHVSVKQKKMTIIKEIEADLTIDANQKLMTHALGNLLDNALKYSEEAGHITLRAYSNGKKVILEISDDGIGIDSEHLDRIFERFYRVDRGRSREVGGTGLGLSLVKHITRIHGAYLEVESLVGKGSTFRMTFKSKK
ncbi:MAG: HAMP domain-containing protein [Candidatus Marinimicrobia bacterium]|nr:HAMP domain-containing protein [Candidatus Neomarinimicrobiota bacterium]MCF7851556.1 HAMP domain-containing protein [Candidatus Neomarinimicrobiota bacterium]